MKMKEREIGRNGLEIGAAIDVFRGDMVNSMARFEKARNAGNDGETFLEERDSLACAGYYVAGIGDLLPEHATIALSHLRSAVEDFQQKIHRIEAVCELLEEARQAA